MDCYSVSLHDFFCYDFSKIIFVDFTRENTMDCYSVFPYGFFSKIIFVDFFNIELVENLAL